MKTYIIQQLCVLALCMATAALSAQEMQQISTGTGYSLQSYANLESGTQQQASNTAWDIAFNVMPGEAGVFINESVGSAMGAAAIAAYYTLSEDFSEIPDSADFNLFPLMNLEKTWSYGALNEIRSMENPDDYGWGLYNPGTGEITGNHVFVIQLRNGDYRKLQIQSLIGGVYTFRHAYLDGTNEVSRTIDKAEHSGKLMAYYSFATEAIVDIEPDGGFDLLFCRYTDLLEDPGGGDPIPYLVTGILSGPGVLVAQADGVDPDTVQYADYQGVLSDDLQVIGHDWKFFDLNAFQWIIEQDRVYFVRTANGRVWKVQFLSFGGSGNGNAVFEKTDLGIVSSVADPHSALQAFDVFPNPAARQTTVVFELLRAPVAQVRIQVVDTQGRIVREQQIRPDVGLHAQEISVEGLGTGFYTIRLVIDGVGHTRTLSVIN